MSTAQPEPLKAPSSFHCVARIGRLLHRVKDRLKPPANKAGLRPLVRRVSDQVIEPQLRQAMDHHETLQRANVAAQLGSGVPANTELNRWADVSCHPSCSSAHGRTDNSCVLRSLQSLHACAATKHVSLLPTAACDFQMLRRENYLQPVAMGVASLQRVINACDELLGALSRLSDSKSSSSSCHPPKHISVAPDLDSPSDFDCEKFVANLQHLLLWLRQCALDAIIRHFANIAETALLEFYTSWLSRKGPCQNWFSEWPNGRRPLSTTWPWNIKPSLVVLWGVCWMFYEHEGQPTSSGSGVPPGQYRQDFWNPPQAAQAAAPPPYTSQPETVADPNNGHANYSWLHPYQAGADARRASQDPADNPGNILPAIPSSRSSTYPYINAPSGDPPNLLSGPSFNVWPNSSGIQTQLTTSLDTPSNIWQSTTNQVALTHDAFPSLNQTPTLPSHAVPQAYPTRSASARQIEPPTARLPFGIGVQNTRRNMQDYPSPQLSDVSGQVDPSYAFAPVKMMASPGAHSIIRSPSVTGSSSSLKTLREPRRNAEGAYVCDQMNCSEGNPAFPRKCEWSKHMDKHTRPYICEEPGCENIRGFTYPGGLNRHQREVHRQHGGPRAACYCPHKDCKRSAGVGFSRKENLAEHLRRVHRDGVTQTAPGSQEPDATSQQLIGGSRKRRRRVLANESEEEVATSSQSPQNLKQEVKKLRRELREKDERLRRLEEQVSLLVRTQSIGVV